MPKPRDIYFKGLNVTLRLDKTPVSRLCSRFFFQRRKKRAVYRPRTALIAEYCDLVSSLRGGGRANGGQRTQNRLEKYYLRAITPQLSFLIPPDGFLMNLAGHIGFFINSVPRIFNLMITVSP